MLDAPVVLPVDGQEVGPFRALGTPGHSADSVCLLFGAVCFTGDTVLGEGSVFIAPGEGSLSAYLDSLRRLRELDLSVLCPGPRPIRLGPRRKLDEYIAHRLDRERRLVEALDSGLRTRDELLDAVWSDAPAELRPAAALTLAAHLEKLSEEGRLPRRRRLTRPPAPGAPGAKSHSSALTVVMQRKRGSSPDDRAIGALAERQHGVVSRAQLSELGLG